jgi:DNA-binding MarR family transcriptional regulator
MSRIAEPQRPSLAALIREASTTYLMAIGPQLAVRGYDDLPRGGVFALATIGRSDTTAGDLGRRMGASKQVVSQLLDALVNRGYIGRSADPNDRRRIRLALTQRGSRAVAMFRAATDRIEGQLLEIVGARCLEQTRTALAALAQLAMEPRLTAEDAPDRRISTPHAVRN